MKSNPHPRIPENFVHFFLDKDLHAKRVLSISNAVTGVVFAGVTGVHAIGRGVAAAKGLAEKHAVKQVDRLLSNEKVGLDDFFDLWVPYVLSGRPVVVVNLDWTDFDLVAWGRKSPAGWTALRAGGGLLAGLGGGGGSGLVEAGARR